jgi:hypothetical protein
MSVIIAHQLYTQVLHPIRLGKEPVALQDVNMVLLFKSDGRKIPKSNCANLEEDKINSHYRIPKSNIFRVKVFVQKLEACKL